MTRTRQMVKKRAVPCICLAVILCAAPVEARTMDERVCLIPVGSVDDAVLEKIKRELPCLVPMATKVTIEAVQAAPEAAYDQSRKQYDALAIMEAVSSRFRLSLTLERTLVVTDADLYVPGADFVFGAADPKKGIAILSLARLRNEFAGGKPDNRLFSVRFLKEAMRELASSRGLGACEKVTCVLSPSADVAAIDKKKSSFCHACRKALCDRYSNPMFRTDFF